MLDFIDDSDRLIKGACIIVDYEPRRQKDRVFVTSVSERGVVNGLFWTSEARVRSMQIELNFKIINRSGQCLSFLGDTI